MAIIARLSADWLGYYNSVRSHLNLPHLTPIAFKQQHSAVFIYQRGVAFQELPARNIKRRSNQCRI